MEMEDGGWRMEDGGWSGSGKMEVKDRGSGVINEVEMCVNFVFCVMFGRLTHLSSIVNEMSKSQRTGTCKRRRTGCRYRYHTRHTHRIQSGHTEYTIHTIHTQYTHNTHTIHTYIHHSVTAYTKPTEKQEQKMHT